jgi:hypothetical protein
MYIIRGLTGVEKSARYAPVDDLCVLQFRESYAVGQAEYLKRIKAGEPGEKARGAILLSQITNFVTDASQTDVRRLAESPYLPPYLCRQFQDILDDSEEPNASISSGQGNLTLRPNDPGFEGILRQRFPVDGVPDAYVRLMSYRGNVFTIAAAAGQSHGNESAILTLDQAIDRSVRLVGMGHVTPHGTAVLDAEIVGPFYAVRQISRARSFTDSSLELVPGGAPPPKSQDELQRRRTQEMQLTQGGLVKLRFHANWHSMLRLGFIRSGKGVQPETRLIVETARKRILYAAAGGKATYERFARQCRKSGIAG